MVGLAALRIDGRKPIRQGECYIAGNLQANFILSNMTMNIFRTRGRLFLLLISMLLMPHPATATELQCKVVEINSGDTISVVNGSGPMKVRLKAIAAPEMEQPWGDVARQHLSDLVLGKTVMVRLTGLSVDRNIVGMVYLNKADIGQQMIRDGVAWYDQSNDSGLDQLERQLYVESEQAARSERRGLWQADSPIPPWEYRQAQAKQAAAAKAATAAQSSPSKTTGGAGTGRAQKKEAVRPSTANWERFAPDGEDFSALLPPVQVATPPKMPKGWSYYQAVSDGLIYQILKCPNIQGESADVLFNNMMGFQTAFHDGARERGISADIYPQRDLPPLNGFTGKQYEMYVSSYHAVMRLYISRRYVYAFGIVGGYEGDPRVDKFLASFTLGKRNE
jgi:micrococcal nuclease